MTETTAPPRRLRRSSQDKVLAGVAGGAARYLGVDPVIVRLVFALSILAGGIGFVAYLLAWVLVPSDDADDPSDSRVTAALDREDLPRIGGAILLFIAATQMFHGWWWAGDVAFPLLLIACGAWLLLRADRPRPAGSEGGDVSTTTGITAVTPPPPSPPIASGPEIEPSPEPAPTTPPERGFPTARATFGVLALAAGGMGLAVAAGADLSLSAALEICLAITGAGLVVGAFVGRARALIVVVLPLVLALSTVTAIDVPFEGGVGERTFEPTTVADLADEYHLAVGDLTLDLRDLDESGIGRQPITIAATVALGSLEIRLPRDATVDGTAVAQLGDVNVQGRSSSGFGADRVIDIAGPEGTPTIHLDLRVGIGEVVVR